MREREREKRERERERGCLIFNNSFHIEDLKILNKPIALHVLINLKLLKKISNYFRTPQWR